MRTNKLFLAAAMLAAGVIGASAQSNVYSLNIVGYVNVPLSANKPMMVANPLMASPNNNLDSVLPASPAIEGLVFSKFNPATGGFIKNDVADATWEGDQPSVSFAPGEGAYFTAPVDTTLTFVGEVVLNATNSVPHGVSMMSSQIPQAGTLVSNLGFPLIEGVVISQFKPTGGFIKNAIEDGNWTGDNFGAEPNIAVAESFYVENPGPATPWIRIFTP